MGGRKQRRTWRLDIVVANVSALAFQRRGNWKNGFDTDMMGTVRLVEAAMPFLESSKSPATVTISSVSGREIDFVLRALRRVQGGDHPLQRKGSPFHLAGKGIQGQTVSRKYLFRGRRWHRIKDEPGSLQDGTGAQSNRPDGHTEGNGDAAVFPRAPPPPPAASFITGPIWSSTAH